MTTVLAIDIGISGAIAKVDYRGEAAVRDIPVIEDASGKRIDGAGLLRVVRDLWPAGHPCLALFEDVRPRSIGNGGKQTNSMFSQGSMMRSRGVVEAVLEIAGLKPQVVQPQVWKRWYALLGTEKKASLEKARVLYPAIAHDLRLAKFHNRAESLLIAHYGLRCLT